MTTGQEAMDLEGESLQVQNVGTDIQAGLHLNAEPDLQMNLEIDMEHDLNLHLEQDLEPDNRPDLELDNRHDLEPENRVDMEPDNRHDLELDNIHDLEPALEQHLYLRSALCIYDAKESSESQLHLSHNEADAPPCIATTLEGKNCTDSEEEFCKTVAEWHVLSSCPTYGEENKLCRRLGHSEDMCNNNQTIDSKKGFGIKDENRSIEDDVGFDTANRDDENKKVLLGKGKSSYIKDEGSICGADKSKEGTSTGEGDNEGFDTENASKGIRDNKGLDGEGNNEGSEVDTCSERIQTTEVNHDNNGSESEDLNGDKEDNRSADRMASMLISCIKLPETSNVTDVIESSELLYKQPYEDLPYSNCRGEESNEDGTDVEDITCRARDSTSTVEKVNEEFDNEDIEAFEPEDTIGGSENNEQELQVKSQKGITAPLNVALEAGDLNAGRRWRQSKQTQMKYQMNHLRAERVDLRAEQAELRTEYVDLRTERAELRAERAAFRAERVYLRAEQEQLRVEQEQLRAEQKQLRAVQVQMSAKQEKLMAEQKELKAKQEQLRAEQKQYRSEQLLPKAGQKLPQANGELPTTRQEQPVGLQPVGKGKKKNTSNQSKNESEPTASTSGLSTRSKNKNDNAPTASTHGLSTKSTNRNDNAPNASTSAASSTLQSDLPTKKPKLSTSMFSRSPLPLLSLPLPVLSLAEQGLLTRLAMKRKSN